MKKILIIALALVLANCSQEDDSNYNTPDSNPEATLLGRWVMAGFEDVIRIEFTVDKRFDIYSDNGIFPTLEEFMATNPLLTGKDWFYDGEQVVVDLNFGNFQRFTPQFICDNYVVQLVNDNNDIVGAYYREGFDYDSCN